MSAFFASHQFPEEVVITHDDDWRDVFKDDDMQMLGPTALELQRVIFDHFKIVEEDGSAFLRATSDPTTDVLDRNLSASSDVIGITVEDPPLELLSPGISTSGRQSRRPPRFMRHFPDMSITHYSDNEIYSMPSVALGRYKHEVGNIPPGPSLDIQLSNSHSLNSFAGTYPVPAPHLPTHSGITQSRSSPQLHTQSDQFMDSAVEDGLWGIELVPSLPIASSPAHSDHGPHSPVPPWCRPRTGSDNSLEPPAWDSGNSNNFMEHMGNIGSALDDTVSIGEVIPPQPRRFDPMVGSPHRSSSGWHGTAHALNIFSFSPTPGSAGLDNGFLSPDTGLRRTKSHASRPPHLRQSRSEDIRSRSTLFPPDSDFMRNNNQFLSPIEPPPSIRGAKHHRSASGGSLRSERGGLGGGSQWSGASSTRPSPYPSPNVTSSPHYTELPFVGDGAPPLVVSKQNVTTVRTIKVSHNRRKQEATFICPVPGCGSTFMRSFNLKGHIRSHNEEKPFLCKWSGFCASGSSIMTVDSASMLSAWEEIQV
ncbi:Calcineurin responsive transcriptional factor [Mycena sanguinolenta]|uniref:Calcineurin responsive transcriptional factor n=1 Tax=Mycena sanguinolenta TaxID=230812 RepID=A0A8H6Z8U5_9AGAR|nr:Calcineurin responsive transcriptional factor [Mycena sanguinolenta]